MPESKIDIMLHPVRIRIISLLMLDNLSPQQLHRALPDIPQATLYRHINKLLNHDVLEIADENPIRGTVEKVYALRTDARKLTQEDMAHLSRDEHLQLFTTFVSAMIGDYSRYLDRADSIHLEDDFVSFSKTPIYLTEEEAGHLREEINRVMMSYLKNPATPQRQRYLMYGITMPDADDPTEVDR